MAQFRKAAKKSEIAPNEGRCVEMEGKRIALFNLGGEFCAINDTCTHAGGSLSESMVEASVSFRCARGFDSDS